MFSDIATVTGQETWSCADTRSVVA